MRFSQIAVLLVAILAMPAAAQQTANPVTLHYHAYRAALERGDLTTADTEATAALEVAQLSPANVTGVAALAMNVALVRLSEGHRDQAMAPAQLAASLVTSVHSGVAPTAVEIVLKRASLRVGDSSGAELLASLNAAHTQNGLDEYVYDGAADLGAWAGQQQQFQMSADAWRLAAQSSAGTSDAAILSRTSALLALGNVLFRMDQAAAPRPVARFDSQVGSTNPDYHPDVEVLHVLADAATLVRPLAQRPGPNGVLTQAQLMFAQATVFYLAAQSRAATFDAPADVVADRPFDHSFRIAAEPRGAVCATHLVADPRPEYPTHAVFDGNVGAAMVRVVVDSAGHVTDSRLVASVGGPEFSQAMERVVPHWRLERSPDASVGCSMAMTQFAVVQFRLAD